MNPIYFKSSRSSGIKSFSLGLMNTGTAETGSILREGSER